MSGEVTGSLIIVERRGATRARKALRTVLLAPGPISALYSLQGPEHARLVTSSCWLECEQEFKVSV